jgi:class 3 adenylate cyclase
VRRSLDGLYECPTTPTGPSPATRETGDDVLITQAARRLLRADHRGFVGRGEAELKGKHEPVRLHAPLAAAAPGSVRLRAL